MIDDSNFKDFLSKSVPLTMDHMKRLKNLVEGVEIDMDKPLPLDLKPIAFISRHIATDEQHSLTRNAGFELIHVGDMDAFHCTDEQIIETLKNYNFASVVNVGLVLRIRSLRPNIRFCVFENEQRSSGSVFQFRAKAIHWYPSTTIE